MKSLKLGLLIILSAHQLYTAEQEESIFIQGGRRMIIAESAILGAYGGYKIGERAGQVTESSMRSGLYSLSNKIGIQTPQGLTIYDFIAGFAGTQVGCALSMFAGASGLAAPFIIAEAYDRFPEKECRYKPVVQKSASMQVLKAAGWGTAGIGLCTGATVMLGGAPVQESTLACTAIYGAFVASAGM